ncbi:NADP-dependent oxidoreductase [Microbacterium sp. VKM Ac-2870]|uniref:quinone oxidoreductase family protein n=1 Tax=Microbacterium sp. VKM Ac-2870 TaxID=2783825 RepID=UPI00188C1C66|nr:NADP-dependent oxidoreductase [Microbacterium sp. VKM Ac-2870]MBF4560833.1 NADP-dependent oxidoreductase [Microbacterium sp. VKM Ac-2870]
MARQWIARAAGAPDTWDFAEIEAPTPRPGQVTIRVRAAGVNPADAKHVARENGQDWPVAIGYEVSGEIVALGPDTQIGSGPATVGDDVVAFRVHGGYATELTVDAGKAFHKPEPLTHAEAANLFLTGTTAAEMLHVVAAKPGETILLHGASGAVGVAVLQLAALRGIRVIGTAAESSFDRVRRFGGTPVVYGPGLYERVRAIAGAEPIAAALDAVGTDEAIDVSLAVVAERSRIVTIVVPHRAQSDGFVWIAGSLPDSARFRDEARAGLVDAANAGTLVVPVADVLPLADAPRALARVLEGHPGGAIALVP